MAPTRVLLATCLLLALPAAAQPMDSRQLGAPAYSLPQNDPNKLLRAADITTKRTTFMYGPGIGGGPSSPIGALAAKRVAADSAITDAELTAEESLDALDTTSATADSAKYNGLKTLDDYTKLYDGEWTRSSAPTGIDPGMLTNYTQDLLFSMERLSFNPYAVRRLSPGKDTLPFAVSNCAQITGQSLNSLFQSNRLFYIDHRAQGQLPRTDKYAAACDAYFYISPSSGNFLPLAIRTNVGSNLIYTPKDKPDDWLLAKMMFNANDFFMGQFHHLAATHYVAEIAFQSAERTLSDDHPIMAMLSRLLYGAFGIRALGLAVLFRPGGSVDQFYGYTGTGATTYANNLYQSGYAGAFQNNYFLTNLQRRGLINASPPLKHFPFYEDASPIYSALRTFMGSFVDSYYPNSAAVKGDTELQAWIAEANGPAKVIDFPQSLTTPSQVADVMAHVAHLVSTAHHTVNTNQLITAAGTLPFNPSGLYKPIPTSKGASNLAAYLPPLVQCINMINSQADFSRPLFVGTNRTLVHMFDDQAMLSRMNTATRSANTKFMAAMMARSSAVSGRGFDGQGLSQGMPFVWKALDPNVAPFSLTI